MRSTRSSAAGDMRRDPEAAVAGEALLRGQVVGVELGRVDPQAAGTRGAVHRHQPAPVGRQGGALGPPDGHGHAGGGLVVGQGVEVDRRVGRPAAGGCPPRTR